MLAASAAGWVVGLAAERVAEWVADSAADLVVV